MIILASALVINPHKNPEVGATNEEAEGYKLPKVFVIPGEMRKPRLGRSEGPEFQSKAEGVLPHSQRPPLHASKFS